jgi:hypothetical protein
MESQTTLAYLRALTVAELKISQALLSIFKTWLAQVYNMSNLLNTYYRALRQVTKYFIFAENGLQSLRAVT